MLKQSVKETVLSDIRTLLSAQEAISTLADICYEDPAAERLRQIAALLTNAFNRLLDDIMLQLAMRQHSVRRPPAKILTTYRALRSLGEAEALLESITLPEWTEQEAALEETRRRIRSLKARIAMYDQHYRSLFEDITRYGGLTDFYIMTAKFKQAG